MVFDFPITVQQAIPIIYTLAGILFLFFYLSPEGSVSKFTYNISTHLRPFCLFIGIIFLLFGIKQTNIIESNIKSLVSLFVILVVAALCTIMGPILSIKLSKKHEQSKKLEIIIMISFIIVSFYASLFTIHYISEQTIYNNTTNSDNSNLSYKDQSNSAFGYQRISDIKSGSNGIVNILNFNNNNCNNTNNNISNNNISNNDSKEFDNIYLILGIFMSICTIYRYKKFIKK